MLSVPHVQDVVVKYEIFASSSTVHNPSFDFGLFLNIFRNNFFASLMIAYLGYFSAGICSVLLLAWNGYLVGCYTTYYPIVENNINYHYFLYHGIFEITALCIAGVIGFKGISLYGTIFSSNKKISFSFNLQYFSVVIILLIISAIIETYMISNFVAQC